MDYTLIVAKKDIKRIESYKYIIKRNIIDSTTIIPQWLQLLLKKKQSDFSSFAKWHTDIDESGTSLMTEKNFRHQIELDRTSLRFVLA